MAEKIKKSDLKAIREDQSQYKKKDNNRKPKREESLKQASLEAMYAIAALQITNPDEFKRKMDELPHAAQQSVLQILASQEAVM